MHVIPQSIIRICLYLSWLWRRLRRQRAICLTQASLWFSQQGLGDYWVRWSEECIPLFPQKAGQLSKTWSLRHREVSQTLSRGTESTKDHREKQECYFFHEGSPHKVLGTLLNKKWGIRGRGWADTEAARMLSSLAQKENVARCAGSHLPSQQWGDWVKWNAVNVRPTVAT